MADIIVSDEEYTKLAENYTKLADSLDNQLEDYITIMTKIIDDAIPEGDVHNNLGIYLTRVTALRGKAAEMIDLLKDDVNAYKIDIDKADGDLY